MKKLSIFTAAALAASALEFGAMGTMAPSMGFAGAALSGGGFKMFYNPALLALEHGAFSWQVAGVQVAQRNLMELSSIDERTAQDFEARVKELEGLFATAEAGSYGNFAPAVAEFASKISADEKLSAIATALQAGNQISAADIAAVGADAALAGKIRSELLAALDAKAAELDANGVNAAAAKAIVSAISADGFLNVLNAVANGGELDAQQLIDSASEVDVAQMFGGRIAHSISQLATSLRDNRLRARFASGFEMNAKGGWGFGLYADAALGLAMQMDSAHDELIVKIAGDTPSQDRFVQLSANGAALKPASKEDFEAKSAFGPNAKHSVIAGALASVQLPVGYAKGFEINESSDVAVGGALRLMFGSGYYLDKKIKLDLNGADGDELDITDDLKNPQTAFSAALDLGAVYSRELSKGILRAGAVAKNLNAPKFSSPGGSIKIKPQLRLGAAYELGNFAAALDIDASANETLDGEKSQLIGGGVRYEFGRTASLRAGLAKDLKRGDFGLIYTGGIGLFNVLDLSVAAASKKSSCDEGLCGSSTDVPRMLDLRLSLGWRY